MEKIIKDIKHKFKNSQSYLFENNISIDLMNDVISEIKKEGNYI
ncbi:hypothetical protein [Wenyingzhuangia sp. 2_MG-2023]|nr:hypothetical protein [Wenyingzhuangia sp. 2_MG-2023]MDO6737115.1 hypothetical protein [Wenyingzhuangia sp. 2_MG-2023]